MDDAELFNALYPRTEDKAVFAVGQLAALASLISAGRALKKGDSAKALFRAVLWVGITNNNNAAYAVRYDRLMRRRTMGMK